MILSFSFFIDINVSAVKQERVCLLVSSYIYDSIKDKLERWISDVESGGVEVIQKVVDKESSENIREFLRSIKGLSGCLMVGDIPYALYETTYKDLEGLSHYEVFPTDLFYMDLDGRWLDNNKNGIFDGHEGDVAPEIWVGRLKASKLSGSEVELLRNYFDKNHLYRIGALTLPHRALIYTDHYFDYYTYDLTPKTKYLLKHIYNEVITVAYPQETTAKDYLSHLQEGWSLVRLFVHSGGFGHYFGNQTDGKVHPIDIRLLDPRAFFYIITSCGNFDYRQKDYIGGWYVFSNSYGLLAIGDSGVHDLLVVLPEAFFLRLKSECFGQAYLHYLQKCVEENARVDSVHNAIMIGDPLLKVAYNGLDSDLDGLSDRYEASIGTNLTRPDSDDDGLTDYKELKLGTNPLNSDTDEDGIKDGKDPNPLDPVPEKALAATVAINNANASIQAALLVGRSKGIENAKALLLNASLAFEKGDYDLAIMFAEQAKEAADLATYPESRREALETQQGQIFNYVFIGITSITILAMVAVYIIRRRTKRGNSGSLKSMSKSLKLIAIILIAIVITAGGKLAH